MTNSRLERALEKFEKAINTSFAGAIPNSLLARQDLESVIVVLSDRGTPFRDKVSRIKGEGLAHLWNQRTRLDTLADGPSGLVQLFYADGQLPNEQDPTYVQKTAAYKYLGTTARHIMVVAKHFTISVETLAKGLYRANTSFVAA